MKNSFLFLFVVAFVATNAQTNLPYDVLHYRFEISLTDSTDVIQGRSIVTVVPVQNISEITLDLKNVNNRKGMTVKSVSVDGSSSSFKHTNNKLTAVLGVMRNAGDTIQVHVNYSGIPADGLIISKNKFGSRTFFSDNWPNRAHNWLPCVDHPGDKASVEFVIIAPDHYQVISNGILVEETDISNGKRLTHWKEEVPLPTKIMVIGVAKFAVQYAGNAHGIPVYSWVYPENRMQGFYDYEPAKEIIPFFVNYVGPYPYKKLANVQSKTIFGGMENASAIFYSENSVTGKRTIETLLAHEIAHQWFGNMVSEKNFSHVWLSEGFATYFTNLYMEHKYGVEKMREMLLAQRVAVINFSKQKQLPVLDTNSSYMELLNANSYQKGAWILHMLRQEVGDDMFQKIIQKYYARYAGKNTDSDDFRIMAEELSGKDLQNFFYQWLRVPGQPKLKIDWTFDQSKNELVINVQQLQVQLYKFPLQLQIKNASGESPIQSVQVDQKQQSFKFQVKQKPAEIIPDPNVQLLAEF